MSNTSQSTAALQRILADTDPDPAGLFDLVVSHYSYTDPGAVEVLCDYAKGSFSSLVTVYAGLQQCLLLQAIEWRNKRMSDKALTATARFKAQVESSLSAQFAHADENDLLEGLRTAHSELPAAQPYMVTGVSRWLSDCVPLEVLTDRVTAEMSGPPWMGFCPELGAGPLLNSDPRVGVAGARNRWLMSRYLHNRFGDHDLLWDMFIHLYDEPAPIGGTADTVTYLHNQFGEHDPSWEMFTKVHDPSQMARDTADLVVAVLHG